MKLGLKHLMMKQRENLFVLGVTLALLWIATYDEPKESPAAVLAGAAPVQPEERPACTAAIVGHQWPEKISGPNGYPMVCAHVGASFVWRPLAARVEQHKKVDKSPTSV